MLDSEYDALVTKLKEKVIEVGDDEIADFLNESLRGLEELYLDNQALLSNLAGEDW